MDYSEKQLESIEKMASVYMTITDIANILDVPADVLREDVSTREHPARKAYNGGKSASKLKLRAQEMKLAQVGSPLALENCMKALIEMEDDE